MSDRKRKPKAAGPRTEVFAMRLDPKLKYLAEIAARKQRRSLANFVEWAIELGLKKTDLEQGHQNDVSVWDKSEQFWDVDEPDRLANLAFVAPELLTYDEQILWKIICETGYLWKGSHDSNGNWQWRTDSGGLVYERMRQCWEQLKQVAVGDAGRDILPVPSKKPPVSLDDEIPF